MGDGSQGVTPSVELVRRYERGTYEDDETTYDVFYIDRLTGREVFCYDGADPANTNPAYGGCSDREMFKRRGLDIDASIERSQCLKPVLDSEVRLFANAMARKAEREKEEAEARELFDVLPPDANDRFDFAQWQDGERTILRPALEAAGYSQIGFYMVEEDSFGPLIRGVRCLDREGRHVRFFYG